MMQYIILALLVFYSFYIIDRFRNKDRDYLERKHLIRLFIKIMLGIGIFLVVLITSLLFFTDGIDYFDANRFNPKVASFSELRSNLQHHFKINIDSLENLTGEQYRLEWDKDTNSKIWDYRTWVTFCSQSNEILKNKEYYKTITQNEEKQFYLKYFFELPLNSNTNIDSNKINLDSLDCQYDVGRMREFDVLNWLMYDRISKKYFFVRCTGHRVKFFQKQQDTN
jgi:hypothetical protein